MRLRDKLDRLGAPPEKRAGAAERAEWPVRAGMAAAPAADVPTRSRAAAPAITPHDDRIARLRSLIGEVVDRDRRRQRRGEQAFVEPRPLSVGELIDTPAGPCHCITRFLEPAHCHGRVPIAGALGVDAELLAKLALDAGLAQVDLSRMLFLDTETTGLAGGSGTVPFLVGMAWFEDGALRIEQLFLRNFGAEAPLLSRLAERVERASCVVTYNGKSFDWPLLRARFVLNRVAVPELPAHVDLLHCVRRVLKPRLPTVRLTEVERELLSLYRDDDIDGALIPGLYLGYLRGGDPRALLGVIEHNDNDLVALAAILSELCRHFDRVVERDDPRDHLAYARVAFRARDEERADRFARAAVENAGGLEVRRDALRLSAAVARRRGDVSAALSAWQAALEAAGDEREAAEAHFALAKLYEHELRNLVLARHHARFTEPVEGPRAQGRRLGRLHRRLVARE